MPLPTEKSSSALKSPSAANGEPLDTFLPPAAMAERDPIQPDYLALLAQATNDAIRDWNVKTGGLAWPQGLSSLFGHYATTPVSELGFWQKNLHHDDASRTVGSIRDALVSEATHWHGEYRFQRADGTYASILERATILRDETGAAVRFVGAMMDITARKQLQDQLCRSQKMEAFGQLAAGLAHDFNNFLTTILGYSDLLLHELRIKGQLASHVTEIRSAAGRASTLTQQLLAFSRKQPLAPKVLEVNNIIHKMERSLLRLLGENVQVVCHLHSEKEAAYVQVDPDQLTQIILNLALNARDAMPKGGRLTVETSIHQVGDTHQTFLGLEDLAPGDYAKIKLVDNGVGMTDEVKAHIFEPFFSTKDHSSGLGLATSYGIVRQSGGHIRVDSETGKGTTIEIFLPRVVAPPVPYKKPGGQKVPGGKETILVLEDDVSVRHISVRLLRGLGYKVIEAANGDDAQRLIADGGDERIDLLLTDMVMPQMSGRHFAKWLHQMKPHTKVVFVSGYLEESLHPQDRRDPDMFFLAKPFDSEQLATKIREALDA